MLGTLNSFHQYRELLAPLLADTPSQAATDRAQAEAGQRRLRYAFWKRQIRTVHWMSGAVCLIGTLLFAATGITLNHAADIPSRLKVREAEATLAPPLVALLVNSPDEGTTPALPAAVARQLRTELGADVGGRQAEWTDVDVYVCLPRPGGDAWLSIDRETGDVAFETTSRGAVAYLNDLHKGRNTGPASRPFGLPIGVEKSQAQYAGLLQAWFLKHKRYPYPARSRRQQGIVKVWFRVEMQGSILERRIDTGSGFTILDKATLDLLDRASPVPKPPSPLQVTDLTFTVPITYSLN